MEFRPNLFVKGSANAMEKYSEDDVWKYFRCLFFPKVGFDILCKLSPYETICMKFQSLLSGKNKNNVTNLSSPGFPQRVIKIDN